MWRVSTCEVSVCVCVCTEHMVAVINTQPDALSMSNISYVLDAVGIVYEQASCPLSSVQKGTLDGAKPD